MAARGEGAGGESEHDLPQRARRSPRRAACGTSMPFSCDAPALAQGFLALLGAKRRQERVEARVVAVVPVELAVLAPADSRRTPSAARSASVTNSRCAEDTRSVARVLDQRRRQLRARASVRLSRQQARAGRRRERRHADELRVVAQAGLRVSARPAPVEDELAPRMRLAVQRQRSFELAAGGLRSSRWRGVQPVRGADAAGAFEREQELVTHERIAARLERIPLLRPERSSIEVRIRAA